MTLFFAVYIVVINICRLCMILMVDKDDFVIVGAFKYKSGHHCTFQPSSR